MYLRQDVLQLTEPNPWPDTLLWYAKAVTKLQASRSPDPKKSMWQFMADIHGDPINRTIRPGDPINQCQHATWYFLPWHRIYVHYFETVVRDTVVSLGGPEDWAVPYWDYSDTTRDDARVLPQAFRDRALPDGSANGLFVSERNANINAGGTLPEAAVETATALRSVTFQNTGNNLVPQFGGPLSDWTHFGPGFGLVERLPHNAVHVSVGGWMGQVPLAARDPIFWLHHANIDRLWVAWIALGGGRANSPDSKWLDESFLVGRGPRAVTLTPGEVVDTTAPPLTYRYQSVDAPEAFDAAFAMPRPASDGPLEMIGASDTPVRLTGSRTTTHVPTEAPAGPAALDASAPPSTVVLRIENITGSEPVSTLFEVFLNLPEGASPQDHPELKVGVLALFGLPEASDPDGHQGGSGLNDGFEISELARSLHAAGQWPPDGLQVSFVPVGEDAPHEDIHVGRVSVHAG